METEEEVLFTGRQASNQAYASIQSKINGLQKIVYNYVFDHGPCTQEDVRTAYADTTNSLDPRFAELKRRGLLRLVGSRKSETTKKKVTLWDVTANCDLLPIKKKLSNKDAVKILLHTIYDIESLLNNPEAEVTRQKIKDIIAEGLHDAGV